MKIEPSSNFKHPNSDTQLENSESSIGTKFRAGVSLGTLAVCALAMSISLEGADGYVLGCNNGKRTTVAEIAYCIFRRMCLGRIAPPSLQRCQLDARLQALSLFKEKFE